MSCISHDLTIESVLADPMIGAAMRADRVDPRRLEELLRSTARNLEGSRRPIPSRFATLASRVRVAAAGSCPQW